MLPQGPPPRAQGKRILDPHDSYREWDFLRPACPAAPEAQPGKLQTATARNTTFSKGFYRRRQRAQPPAQASESSAASSSTQARREARAARLRSLADRNGNVLTGAEPASPPPFPASPSGQSGRKHFVSELSPVAVREGRIRELSSSLRFHAVPDESARAARLRAAREREAASNRTSSLLGYGRNDIASKGVLDNFEGHGF
jgi:hypothetical protein